VIKSYERVPDFEQRPAGKQFFFEKKNQKTFALLVSAAGKIASYRSE